MSELKNAEQASCAVWWGTFAPEIGTVLGWTVGPLEVAAWRREKEWQICHRSCDWPDDVPSGWTVSERGSFTCDQGLLQRHVFSHTEGLLSVEPALADRSVVIKAAVAIMIPPGQQIRFFVSTPLWLKIKCHSQQHLLLDTAATRLSDTWFGPSTMEGELCYATTSSGRLSLDDLPVRAHRAITPVQIRNNGEVPLKLEKLSLPVPFLALFDSCEHGLWTQEITLIHDERKALAQVVFSEKPPLPYEQARTVSSPRKVAEKGMLYRTFGAFFGG